MTCLDGRFRVLEKVTMDNQSGHIIPCMESWSLGPREFAAVAAGAACASLSSACLVGAGKEAVGGRPN